MDTGRASATAEGAAIMRALHQQLPPASRILDDAIAERLIDPSGDAYRSRLSFLASLPAPVRSRLTHFVLRSRYAEDCLASACHRGVRQYVILGAGLDTFAYRQPTWARSLRIFEVDHPATQTLKRERLANAGIVAPPNVVLAPVDFDRVSLPAGLSGAGFDPAIPTFFSMLGVSQYLTLAALDGTLAFVLEMPQSSEIVLTVVLPDDALPADEALVTRAYAARFAAIGEPWRTRLLPDQLVARLKARGFREAAHLTTAEANARYFGARSDGLTASIQEQMVRAVV